MRVFSLQPAPGPIQTPLNSLRALGLRSLMVAIALSCLTSVSSFQAAAADPVPVTLLHTNDLHSHFRPERTRLGLGGVARIKTAVEAIRKQSATTWFVDGGDWSEGQIYYNLGAGVETLRMMDHLSYDVAVVGNHDWLNGPDILLQAHSSAQPKMALIAANLNLDQYPKRSEFRKKVPPYVIQEKNGVKIAFIGLVTYEFIYDSFFTPVKITSPFQLSRDLAAELKRHVDVVVVISHNNLRTNEELLRRAPDVDLVVGAHDHKKLLRPIVVERPGRSSGWVVEAGSWGRFIGKVELSVRPRQGGSVGTGTVELKNYELIQMDSRIPDDAETLRRIEALEEALEKQYGEPLFHDHVADNHVEITRFGAESRMGNVVTDAYFRAVPVDLALDQVNFIYGELLPGELRSADVYNSNPAIYNPTTGKAWTLKIFPIRGRTLVWLMNTLFSTKFAAQAGVLSGSGFEMIYNPVFQQNPSALTVYQSGLALSQVFSGNFNSPEVFESWDSGGGGIGFFNNPEAIVREIRIGGKPLKSTQTYQVAAGGGIIHAIEFLNSIFPGAVPLDGLRDTGIEDWRILSDHLRSLSPVTSEKIPMGTRIRSEQPDLGVLAEDVNWEPIQALNGAVKAKVTVSLRNSGFTPSAPLGAWVKLLGDRNGTVQSKEPQWVEVGPPQSIRALQPGESQTFEWTGVIPGDHSLYPVTVVIGGIDVEVNLTNNQIQRWFQLNL